MEKVLILGGTQFIGRTLVEFLMKNPGFHITLFNRQKTGVDLFPDLRKIKGDRETNDIQQIASAHWDYVIDVSCYYPESLRLALRHLVKIPKKYIFVSTCSVYDDDANAYPLKDETTSILNCTVQEEVDRTNASYGQRKSKCEEILLASGMNYTILRPALVYGPYDHTDRFYYWLYQAMFHDPILLPDNGERKFSLTFVHDLVKVIINSLLGKDNNIILNVISHPEASINQIVTEALYQFNRSAETLNASPDFLVANEIGQWMDMPLWIDGDHFTYKNDLMKSTVSIPITSFTDSLMVTAKYFDELEWPVPDYGIDEKKRLDLIYQISN